MLVMNNQVKKAHGYTVILGVQYGHVAASVIRKPSNGKVPPKVHHFTFAFDGELHEILERVIEECRTQGILTDALHAVLESWRLEVKPRKTLAEEAGSDDPDEITKYLLS